MIINPFRLGLGWEELTAGIIWWETLVDYWQILEFMAIYHQGNY
jgi:hypothetical protein